MNLSFINEPDLEFARGGYHIDVRYGITQFGPLDFSEPTAPVQLRVGLVGTDLTIDAFRRWLERCKDGVAAKRRKVANLVPAFRGFSDEVAFRSSLIFHDKWCSTIRQREIDAVLAQSEGDETVRQFVGMFVDHAEELVQHGGPMVIICIPP